MQMEVKVVNDLVGPDGLVQTLIAYSTSPRASLFNDPATTSACKHTIALWKATKAMKYHFSVQQVCNEIATFNRPDVADIRKTPIGYFVVVFRLQFDR